MLQNLNNENQLRSNYEVKLPARQTNLIINSLTAARRVLSATYDQQRGPILTVDWLSRALINLNFLFHSHTTLT